MKKSINFLISISFITTMIFAQLSAPNVEAVYGGRINSITGFAKNADTTRIFISTESANSIFYTDVYSNTLTPVFSAFSVMPGVDASAGYGSNIQDIAAHESSGNIYFIHDNGLLYSNPSSSTVGSVSSNRANALLIKDDYLFFIEGPFFNFGTLDASGNYSASSGSPIMISSSGGMQSIHINPSNDSVYIFANGLTPSLYVLSDTYSVLNGSTTDRDISPTVSTSSVNWNAFGIRNDGWAFMIGDDGLDKHLMHNNSTSISSSSWTYFSVGINGVSARNIDFSRSGSPYKVYHANMYSNNDGMSGSWQNFGSPGGIETHPNDGAVFVDPINENVVYLTTDQGIGASVDGGATIFEIDNGVEAVQVNDLDMTTNKNTAWLASKSGIRKVINYQSSPLWTNAMFPNGDGSPYYSVDMNPADTNDIYVGNVRIYKTEDNGNNWSQVFTPEDPPYNFSNIGTKALAIEVCDYDPNIVMAGFEIWEADKGGLFVSYDAGNSWDQILIEASSVGNDVDVSDIVFNLEGSDTVAYVSVLYDLTSPQGRSVYKLTKSGTSWSVQQDMNSGTTSTGSLIVATIWDLQVSVTGDTIIAAGTDAGINHPIAYYKPLNTTGVWTPFTTSGFPFSLGKEATAVSIGVDTVFCAVDHEIYYHVLGSSSWSLGYSYPVGTRINVLFYDELLAGSDLGLYAFFGTGGTTSVNETDNLPANFSLAQNYPNPFNPTTSIEYTVPSSEQVSLKVYDVLGNEITTLVNENKSPGSYKVNFDSSNLSSGVYFYRLNFGNQILTKKMLLLK